MELIDDSVIDFQKYMKTPIDAARVKPASEWLEGVIEKFYGESATRGSQLPWSKTHAHIRLRPHEVSVWGGINGHGKSLVLNQVMLSAMQQNEKVCIASFEMTPEQTMQRMTRQAVGVDRPTVDYIRRFHSWTDNRLWIYDQLGTARSDRLLAVARYCRDQLCIDHLVIDSLMKCGIGVDDYNRQKSFVDELCAIAKNTGLHIHLVAHSRKRETEKTIMDKFDIKGASEITDMVDNVFTVWRNKKKEDAKRKPEPDQKIMQTPDALVNCDKQRHGEWEGKIPLFFESKSMQFRGSENGWAVSIFE